MQWIEIIKVRSAGTGETEAVADIFKDFSRMDKGTQPTTVKLYHHASVESDLCIHIYWDSETMPSRKSPMGLRIVDAIGPLGTVNHSIWIEDTVGAHAFPRGSR